jgi:hypothetical protein
MPVQSEVFGGPASPHLDLTNQGRERGATAKAIPGSQASFVTAKFLEFHGRLHGLVFV